MQKQVRLLAFLCLLAWGMYTVQPVSSTAVPPLRTLAVQPAAYIIQLPDGRSETFVAAATAVLRRPLVPIFHYQHAFHGLALTLSGDELHAIAQLPQVKAIYRDAAHYPLSDAGPGWIGAPAVWHGSAGVASRGEGIIIGVIDTGINADHPTFARVGGDGYHHQNPWGSGQYVGVCDPGGSQYDVTFPCNDKVIGAWNFADGPEDNNGHGSHVAAIAAGNILSSTLMIPNGFSAAAMLSGVAPHANLVIYDACTHVCQASALLAAIDQAVADGVDVLLFALSGGVDPYHDPVELALLAAREAGIFVATAGGEDGLQHQGAWVMTAVGASHNRHFTAILGNLTADSGSQSGGQNAILSYNDIPGKGLTPAYGPAPVVYAGDFGDAQCTVPFAPHTWANGEMVLCEAGAVSPVNQGVNVRAGGAGALIWVAPPAAGVAFTTAVHGLPAIHISYAHGLGVKSWLAAGENHTAVIGATTISHTAAAADILTQARIQSGGNILKPDIAAPGADIWAADRTTLPISPPEFATRSGSSQSAAHLAGAAALLTAVHPGWTPDEIRSSLMMTAVSHSLRQPNGIIPATPFEHGAGRLNLADAARAGLVLDETTANYQAAAHVEAQTLNLPALVDAACFQTCAWTRVFRSTLETSTTWTATAVSPPGLAVTLMPAQFTLTAGAVQTVTITVDVTNYFAGQGWAFADVRLAAAAQPALHLPLAVQKAGSSAPGWLLKSGPSYATPGQILTYEIWLDNLDVMTHTFALTDTLPPGVVYIPGSASGGVVYEPQTRQFTWQGEIGPGTRGYTATAVYPPPPYVNLGDIDPSLPDLCDAGSGRSLGWSKTWRPGVGISQSRGGCDDTAVTLDLSPDAITFYDETFDSVRASSNGALLGPTANLEIGCHPCPQRLPNPTQLNHIIAGLWRDLDLDSSGQWYAAYLNGWLPGETVLYVNWHNAAQWGDALLTSRHAVALPLDGQGGVDGRIYFVYDHISEPDRLLSHGYTIGVENGAGSEGLTLAHAPCLDAVCLPGASVGAPPAAPAAFRLNPATVGGSSARLFTYRVQVTAETATLLTNQVDVTSEGPMAQMTAVADTLVQYRRLLPIIFR